MPSVKINAVDIDYEWLGDGPETVVMLHSMGLNRGGMRPLADLLKDMDQ